jgi:uncharacterized protein
MKGARRTRPAFALPLLGLCLTAFAQSLQPVPQLESRVTDLTGTLTAEHQTALERKLAAFEARKGSDELPNQPLLL